MFTVQAQEWCQSSLGTGETRCVAPPKKSWLFLLFWDFSMLQISLIRQTCLQVEGLLPVLHDHSRYSISMDSVFIGLYPMLFTLLTHNNAYWIEPFKEKLYVHVQTTVQVSVCSHTLKVTEWNCSSVSLKILTINTHLMSDLTLSVYSPVFRFKLCALNC